MTSSGKARLSVVIPAKNESIGLQLILPQIRTLYPNAEIIVVDDGSTDDTAAIAGSLGAKVVSHLYSMGNGAAIKSGARAATGDVLVFMDADGQHRPEDIAALLTQIDAGYDLVVGARDADTHASWARRVANGIYNRLASWMVGHPIPDLTSGLRAARAERFRHFLHLLPNGFSYPTTSTMAFFRAGYPVTYVPIRALKRSGSSHIRLLHDGVRFFLIIFRIGTLYSPLKLFFPVSGMLFMTGVCYYLYTYLTAGRFTNMSALLFIVSVVVFMIGLVSEQITNMVFTPKA